MLAVFALLTASGIILATLGQLEHKSYLIELILSVIVLALAVLLYRRRKDKPMFVDRWSPWLTGSIITLICFAVNLAWVMSCHVEPIIDFYTNYMTAVKIANNDWIHLDRMYLALFPHIFGYAWFMSGFISHFGESALLIPIINVMATVLTGIMIYNPMPALDGTPLRSACIFSLGALPVKTVVQHNGSPGTHIHLRDLRFPSHAEPCRYIFRAWRFGTVVRA